MTREVQLLINTPQMRTAVMWSKDWSWSGQNTASLDKSGLVGELRMQSNPQCISAGCILLVVEHGQACCTFLASFVEGVHVLFMKMAQIHCHVQQCHHTWAYTC